MTTRPPPRQTLLPGLTLENLRSTFESDQFTETLGIRFVAIRPDGMDAEVVVSKTHLRPDGIANGSLALALVETVGSVSGCCAIDFARFNVFGMNVTVNHFKPALEGDRLVARSTPMHVGRSTHVWDVEIRKGGDSLVSSGRITLMILPRRETGTAT